MNFKIYLSFVIVFSISIFSCKTSQKPGIETTPDNKITVEEKKAKPFLQIIDDINTNTPDDFKCSLNLKIIANNKKYNVNGRGYYLSKPMKAKIILNDNVFRFRIMDILVKDSKISMYYPMEKNVVVDNFATSGDSLVSNSSGYNSNVLANLFIGKIPLIEKYKVTKVYTNEQGTETYIDLENSSYLQTISFKNNIVQKIILKSKISSQHISMKYYGHFLKSDFHFFKSIEIVSKNPYSYFRIGYKGIVINSGLEKTKIFSQNIPADTKRTDLR